MTNIRIIIIALLSISLISIELIWTRIFSAEFFYTFAFLILSLAILGLGLGALTLRLFPRLNKESNLGVFLSLSGLMILAGPSLVFQLGLDLSVLYSSQLMIGKFLATLILLNFPFFFGGIALAMFFKNNHIEIPQLYMADLAGAGIGVLIAILLMNIFGTPLAAFLSAIPILIGTYLISQRWLKLIPVLLILASIIGGIYAGPTLKAERKERIPVIYEHWDAMAKIKMGTYGDDDMYRNINIDNAANTPVAKFDGNWDRPDTSKFWFDIDIKYLINKFDNCTFLSLGSGGGQDVMQALQNNVSEIHAVEVVPHINYLMTEGELLEYTGRIYQDPRVIVATEDARAYVRRFENKFDIIYSLSSNSWAALSSGSFALAENYLFTTEAFKDYWNALSENGFLTMEHQIYMPRIVSEVKNALDELGVPNPKSHFAVYEMAKMRRKILLVSKQPLTEEILENAYAEVPAEMHNFKSMLFPAVDSLKNNLINQIIQNGWEAVEDSAAIDISPCTDNRPFIAQLGLWKNFQWNKLEKVSRLEFSGFPISKLNIVVILIIVIIFIVPLNLIPYFKKGEKLKAVPWLYFFVIGMAFMTVEIILIQKYTLLIGSSVYSLITILLTLLICSGIGSKFARNIDTKIAFAGIIVWLLLDIFVFKHLIYAFGGLSLFPRLLFTIILIAPLGFFMGIPFPKAGIKVGELVDWGFAVNGAASVLGSTLVMIIAFSYGFSVALGFGLFLYLVAYYLISVDKAW